MVQRSNHYTVRVSRTATKEYEKISEPLKTRIGQVLRLLETDPYMGKHLKVRCRACIL